MEKIIARRFDIPNSHKIDTYLADGGYETARKALTQMTPSQGIEKIKKSKDPKGRVPLTMPMGICLRS